MRAKFVSGVISDLHAETIFEENCPDLSIVGSFTEDFIRFWLEKDADVFKDYIANRGEIVIVDNLYTFNSSVKMYPSHAEILAANL